MPWYTTCTESTLVQGCFKGNKPRIPQSIPFPWNAERAAAPQLCLLYQMVEDQTACRIRQQRKIGSVSDRVKYHSVACVMLHSIFIFASPMGHSLVDRHTCMSVSFSPHTLLVGSTLYVGLCIAQYDSIHVKLMLKVETAKLSWTVVTTN